MLTYSDGSTENLGSVASALAQNGEKGDTGAQGEKGEAGAQGEKGETGAQGEKGETGAQGEKGETGAQGEKGETGAQGEKGETGAQGESGADGITPQIRINDSTNEWEVSTDNGSTWKSTGVKATGSQGEAGKDGIAPQIRINDTSKEWEVSTDNGDTWISTKVSAVAAPTDASSAANSENPQELAFFPLPDGTYAVGKGNSTYLTEIVIPATYKGKAVTKITKDGFRGHTSLISITIPASVTCIDAFAFANCTALEEVVFEANSALLSIAENAFQHTALKSFTIPASVTSLGTQIFVGCEKLSAVTFESTVGWWTSTSPDATSGQSVDVSKPTSNKNLLTNSYKDRYWKRITE